MKHNAWYSNAGTDKWNDETGEVIDSTAETNSLFVDPQQDDYRLKPDSPAVKLGFQPIDIGKIGIRKQAED